MHLWRLPLVNFAALFAFSSVVVVLEAVAWLRRHSESTIGRGILLALGAVAALSSPLIVHVIVDPELRDLASRGVYAHYGRVSYLGPGVGALILFALSRRALPQSAPRVALARTVFWLTTATFAVLNLANWCSPGWCARFGFPFRYSWWSDATVVMNGENLTAGSSIVAMIADGVVLLGVAVVASRRFAQSASDSAHRT